MSSADVITIYRRIRKAYENGTGVRLTAEEVDHVWTHDDAVRTAVFAADERDNDTCWCGRELSRVRDCDKTGCPAYVQA